MPFFFVLGWWDDAVEEEVEAALEVVLVDVDEGTVAVIELVSGTESVDWEVGEEDVVDGDGRVEEGLPLVVDVFVGELVDEDCEVDGSMGVVPKVVEVGDRMDDVLDGVMDEMTEEIPDDEEVVKALVDDTTNVLLEDLVGERVLEDILEEVVSAVFDIDQEPVLVEVRGPE